MSNSGISEAAAAVAAAAIVFEFMLRLCDSCIDFHRSDVMFAVDSIPAVFGVTEDPLIVLSSNIFAIMR